ncbi:MAG: type IV toxin-antitoxin system AbiEi family antitoxin domain-containing protein [Actinotalea sp.]|nr:type IV toxin-antitoxin system AbiEi family antitoxin domain-containing protein [Actinotalea sp.]
MARVENLPSTIRDLARRQDGVVSVAQCVARGVGADAVERRARTGQWVRLHRGVYVTHAGRPTWRAGAWAALLLAGTGAALSHRSAAYVHGIVRDPPRGIEVSVPEPRRVTAVRGVVVRRSRRLEVTARGGLPVTPRGPTVLDLVDHSRTTDDVVGLLTSAVRAGVPAREVLDALRRRPRARHRGLVTDLLGEVGCGAESPMELRYHRDVERAHGLPRSTRQVAQVVGGRWIRADAVYVGLGVRVELDGELAHPGGRTVADTWRDNAVLVELGEITLRYRWHHVRVTPCLTARQVAQALRSRGWDGVTRRCTPTCAAR